MENNSSTDNVVKTVEYKELLLMQIAGHLHVRRAFCTAE